MSLYLDKNCPKCKNATLSYVEWVDTPEGVRDRFECSVCGHTELFERYE